MSPSIYPRFNVFEGERRLRVRISERTCLRESWRLMHGIDVVLAPVARFRIKRLSSAILTDRPWVVRDYERPAWLGQYPTHKAAIAYIDRRLATEALRDLGVEIEVSA